MERTSPVPSDWQLRPGKAPGQGRLSIGCRPPLVFALILMTCGGCAVPAASVVSPALSSGVPVVAQGSEAGHTDSFWIARYDDVVRAALRAADKLSLELEEEVAENGRTSLRFTDSKNKVIHLVMEFRTESVTRVSFDPADPVAGGMTRLLARQMAKELDDAGAFLVDWGS